MKVFIIPEEKAECVVHHNSFRGFKGLQEIFSMELVLFLFPKLVTAPSFCVVPCCLFSIDTFYPEILDGPTLLIFWIPIFFPVEWLFKLHHFPLLNQPLLFSFHFPTFQWSFVWLTHPFHLLFSLYFLFNLKYLQYIFFFYNFPQFLSELVLNWFGLKAHR